MIYGPEGIRVSMGTMFYFTIIHGDGRPPEQISLSAESLEQQWDAPDIIRAFIALRIKAEDIQRALKKPSRKKKKSKKASRR